MYTAVLVRSKILIWSADPAAYRATPPYKLPARALPALTSFSARSSSPGHTRRSVLPPCGHRQIRTPARSKPSSQSGRRFTSSTAPRVRRETLGSWCQKWCISPVPTHALSRQRSTYARLGHNAPRPRIANPILTPRCSTYPLLTPLRLHDTGVLADTACFLHANEVFLVVPSLRGATIKCAWDVRHVLITLACDEALTAPLV